MTKFKVGNRVRLTKKDRVHKKGLIFNINSFCYNGEEEPQYNYCWRKDDLIGFKIEHLELVKETDMKDTITLRELIEKDACKELLLWFSEWFCENEGQDRGNNLIVQMNIKKIICRIKKNGKPVWLGWLRKNNYSVTGDKKQAKIDKLESKLNELQTELEELKND